MNSDWLRKNRFYLGIAAIGLAAIAVGQFMARPQFYGTTFGRAWAHVSLLGFLLLAGSLLGWAIDYVSHHRNSWVVTAGKRQAIGMIGLTGVVGLFGAVAVMFGDTALTWNDGEARRGVFVLWLLLIASFTIGNLGWLILELLKRRKRV